MSKSYFKSVDPKINFPGLEENIIKYWKKEKIFEKSVDNIPINKKWTFLDGPPFITGLPHYGTLLSSIPKDIFPRYWTMKGYRVRRVWGWDCHGLPAENKVENKLGLKSKREIEKKIGIKRFIDECKLYVSETSSEWEWYIDHIGRWVDFKNAYRTMDLDYMETVMWVFKNIYAKGYIYKGLRVSLYCPHCETPISNFEVAMDSDNYKMLTEDSTTYKYPLADEDNTYLLAWSTTPWNKIATPALAVNPDLDYVKVKQGTETLILAEKTLGMLKDIPYKVAAKFKGSELVGKKFVPHFDYYKNKVEDGKKIFEVVPAAYVSGEDGTGIVTLAVYGEEDLDIMKKENVHMEMHVKDNGMLKGEVPKFGGLFYTDVNDLVEEDLEKRNLIYDKSKVSHSIPHCWRCGTRLFHNPQVAWYIDIQKLKPTLEKNNKKIIWIPKHFKYGRFLKSMQAAPDWCISRSRYWGSPVPVWECVCGQNYVPGSIEELQKMSKRKIKDLHKPEIDDVTIKCTKCGKLAKRTPEVLDSWVEAGSAPYAERHFPFETGINLEDFFPPDFITEYTGQIRAWFYVLHVIASALYESPAFKDVLVTGVILGTDGRKMSKNYGNYPDPKMMLQTYGGDALRCYLMGSPVMKGEDILISEQDYRNKVRGFLLPLWNVYNFFITYANADNWKPNGDKHLDTKNVLDKWILSRLTQFQSEVEKAYDAFDTVKITEIAESFLVYDLSGWYVRRSRDRFNTTIEANNSKSQSYFVFWYVLKEFTKAISPLIPFTTEEIYRNITKEESVHLSLWTETNKNLRNIILEEDMKFVRTLVEKIHALRKKVNIPVRQPLTTVLISSDHRKLASDLEKILLDEVNIKKVSWIKSGTLKIKLDTKITPELAEEANLRKLVRQVQEERKKQKMSISQKINLQNTWFPQDGILLEKLKKATLAVEIKLGDFSVKKG